MGWDPSSTLGTSSSHIAMCTELHQVMASVRWHGPLPVQMARSCNRCPTQDSARLHDACAERGICIGEIDLDICVVQLPYRVKLGGARM